MNEGKYEKRHVLNQKRYANKIAKKYGDAIDGIAKEIARLPIKEGVPFSFSECPLYIRVRVNTILRRLQKDIADIILSGVRTEASLADSYVNNSMREFLNEAVSRHLISIRQREAITASYAYTSVKAALKFAERSVEGLGLSERVWSFTKMMKTDVELILQTGIMEGTSASQMSRKIRNALKGPAKLFRAVKQPDGTYRLSKVAKAYHPGQGVYRSSYKNALRLVATETNIAYRSSVAQGFISLPQHDGWEINLSNNHTCKNPKTGKPEPFFDICDELQSVPGDTTTYYPYDWIHIGWHPACRCFAKSYSARSFERIIDDILHGTNDRGGNIVVAPRQLEAWKAKSLDRYLGYATMPYFIAYNQKYFE